MALNDDRYRHAHGPERDDIQRAIPELKERLKINVEFASPADFIPVKTGWEDRSPFAAQSGHVPYFDEIAASLYKYPAIDAADFRGAVVTFVDAER